jgi:hypothetical protein
MEKGIKDSWWEKWSNSDSLVREELVKDLPFVRDFDRLAKFPKKLRENVLTMNLNLFFSDLEEYLLLKDCSRST